MKHHSHHPSTRLAKALTFLTFVMLAAGGFTGSFLSSQTSMPEILQQAPTSGSYCGLKTCDGTQHATWGGCNLSKGGKGYCDCGTWKYIPAPGCDPNQKSCSDVGGSCKTITQCEGQQGSIDQSITSCGSGTYCCKPKSGGGGGGNSGGGSQLTCSGNCQSGPQGQKKFCYTECSNTELGKSNNVYCEGGKGFVTDPAKTNPECSQYGTPVPDGVVVCNNSCKSGKQGAKNHCYCENHPNQEGVIQEVYCATGGWVREIVYKCIDGSAPVNVVPPDVDTSGGTQGSPDGTDGDGLAAAQPKTPEQFCTAFEDRGGNLVPKPLGYYTNSETGKCNFCKGVRDADGGIPAEVVSDTYCDAAIENICKNLPPWKYSKSNNKCYFCYGTKIGESWGYQEENEEYCKLPDAPPGNLPFTFSNESWRQVIVGLSNGTFKIQEVAFWIYNECSRVPNLQFKTCNPASLDSSSCKALIRCEKQDRSSAANSQPATKSQCEVQGNECVVSAATCTALPGAGIVSTNALGCSDPKPICCKPKSSSGGGSSSGLPNSCTNSIGYNLYNGTCYVCAQAISVPATLETKYCQANKEMCQGKNGITRGDDGKCYQCYGQPLGISYGLERENAVCTEIGL